MARRLLVDNDGGVFCFRPEQRLDAFGAAELISEKLALEAQVVRHRDTETGLRGLAIALTVPKRDVFEEEIVEALSICRFVVHGV